MTKFVTQFARKSNQFSPWSRSNNLIEIIAVCTGGSKLKPRQPITTEGPDWGARYANFRASVFLVFCIRNNQSSNWPTGELLSVITGATTVVGSQRFLPPLMKTILPVCRVISLSEKNSFSVELFSVLSRTCSSIDGQIPISGIALILGYQLLTEAADTSHRY